MSRAGHALRELHALDELAGRRSPLHDLCPLTKLLSTLLFLWAVLSFGRYELARLSPLLLWLVLLFQLGGVSVGMGLRKLRFVLPLVLAVGLANPLLDRAPLLTLGCVRVSGGVVSMLTLAAKGTLCLLASFLLAATTRIDALCAALRRLHVPGLLVSLLLLTWRYVGVLTEEVAVMTDAYALRAPGQRGVAFRAWGSFLGQLLLRSMDRAEELYAAMRLRGWEDDFPYAACAPCTARDAAFLLGNAAVLALLRGVDVPALLGAWIVR